MTSFAVSGDAVVPRDVGAQRDLPLGRVGVRRPLEREARRRREVGVHPRQRVVDVVVARRVDEVRAAGRVERLGVAAADVGDPQTAARLDGVGRRGGAARDRRLAGSGRARRRGGVIRAAAARGEEPGQSGRAGDGEEPAAVHLLLEEAALPLVLGHVRLLPLDISGPVPRPPTARARRRADAACRGAPAPRAPGRPGRTRAAARPPARARDRRRWRRRRGRA